MPGIILSPESRHTAMKRPAEEFSDSQYQHDASQHPAKRSRMFHHSIRHKQPAADQCLQGAQDEVFFQSQLMRAITLSLSAQGFDSVDSTALEAFRLATETYMFQFLKSVNSSMQGARREAPTPADFTVALARSNLTSSQLSPFLTIPPSPSICQPAISSQSGADKISGNSDTALSTILQSSDEEVQMRQKHIPRHLPGLPSRHTWKATAVVQTREEDARKLRERATQEGVMAEQALRRLMEASIVGDKDKFAKGCPLVGQGRSARSWHYALETIESKDEEEVAQELRRERELSDASIPPAIGATLSKVSPNETFESAAVVNSGRLRWRELARGKG